ncbi:type 1 glutamine amidotransferase [Aquamicrobium segne]|uniref:Type 1 glutamine amidotransferase n=1 Tax=Aquamicrobium segne TaxID=469547 RepID=A0ABW0GYR9_9HYPH
MQILVVENYEGTGLGQMGVAIGLAGGTVDIRRPYLGDALPQNADGHDGLVVLGGAQNAMADDVCPYFPALLNLIRDFEKKDRAIAGICLGSQLLARAFGGKNRIGGAREFGWTEIELTETAKGDAVFADLPEEFSIFQWHDDSFTLPEQATRLAGSAAVKNQAFRVGRAAYGFQFHFEADAQLVRQWSADFAPLIEKISPDWPQRLEQELAGKAAEADKTGLAIARNWVATVGAG